MACHNSRMKKTKGGRVYDELTKLNMKEELKSMKMGRNCTVSASTGYGLGSRHLCQTSSPEDWSMKEVKGLNDCANFCLRCDTIDDSGVSTQRHDDEDKCAK